VPVHRGLYQTDPQCVFPHEDLLASESGDFRTTLSGSSQQQEIPAREKTILFASTWLDELGMRERFPGTCTQAKYTNLCYSWKSAAEYGDQIPK